MGEREHIIRTHNRPLRTTCATRTGLCPLRQRIHRYVHWAATPQIIEDALSGIRRPPQRDRPMFACHSLGVVDLPLCSVGVPTFRLLRGRWRYLNRRAMGTRSFAARPIADRQGLQGRAASVPCRTRPDDVGVPVSLLLGEPRSLTRRRPILNDSGSSPMLAQPTAQGPLGDYLKATGFQHI